MIYLTPSGHSLLSDQHYPKTFQALLFPPQARMSVLVTIPAWTISKNQDRYSLNSLFPELFLEPILPLTANVNADDSDSQGSVNSLPCDELSTPQSHTIDRHIICSTPFPGTPRKTIYVHNPLALFYLRPASHLASEHPVNLLLHAIQLEHCKETSIVVRGELLVIQLSLKRPETVVNLPHEHVKYIELITAL